MVSELSLGDDAASGALSSEGADVGQLHNPDDRQNLDGKAFIKPVIFSNVTDEMTIAKEEIFGPVASVLKFYDTEEVLSRSNDTPFGLAAGFFTTDLKKAHYVSKRLQAGIVWCNTFNIYDPAVPVGGYKQSGFGREFGEEALECATQTKSVYFDLSDAASIGEGLEF